MGILSDRQIEKLAANGMIQPYSPMQKREGVISYGLSSAGYDVRLGYQFKVFRNYPHSEIDPKKFDPKLLEDVDLTPCEESGLEPNNFIRIPPHSFILGESIEEFNIPRDILVVCLGKSTYARCGIIVNVTPGEPEWPGKWTIEVSNTTPLPVRVYAGEGIMQCLFFRSDEHREGLHAATRRAMNVISQGRTIEGAADAVDLIRMTEATAGCGVSYKDKKGKYVDQQGLTLPKVD